MEFKLPFPTLQDLAVLQIAHSLMDLEVSYDILVWKKSLCESLSKVDKLKVHEIQKCDIREALKGTHDHLQNWYTSRSLNLTTHYGNRPKLRFDVHGRVDEVRMAKNLLKKCHSDERYDTNVMALKRLLCVASYYVLLPDIEKIVLTLLKLEVKDSAIPQLEGPEYEIIEADKLHLVYRIVDQQGMLIPFNFNYFNPFDAFSSICLHSSRFRINLERVYYNPELFQLHWNLLEPSKRMPFVRSLMKTISLQTLVRQVVHILNVLDPASLQCFFEDNEHKVTKYLLLKCLLVWPYQELFLPLFQLTELIRLQYFELFIIIVNKLDMMAFRDILMPLWEAIPVVRKSFLSKILAVPDQRCRYGTFKKTLRMLSQKSAPMLERVMADLNLPLSHLQDTRKRSHDCTSSAEELLKLYGTVPP